MQSVTDGLSSPLQKHFHTPWHAFYQLLTIILPNTIPNLRTRLDILGVQKLQDSSLSEEQEREVSHEVHEEWQIERPPESEPVSHSMHYDLTMFVQNGTIQPNSAGIVSLFQPLKGSHISDLSAWSSNLLATTDFCNTITNLPHPQINEYMRPLNWILSSRGGNFVVLSPYEANELLPLIRSSKSVRLHVYAPRTTESMTSFSNLQFYSVPSLPVCNWTPPPPLVQIQVNLWGGQLYMKDFSEYRVICGFLGISLDTDGHESDIPVQSDGFVMPTDRQLLATYRPEYATCKFSNSPVNMLKELIGRRRKGMEYMRTHLGQVLHARQLSPNDF